MSVLLVFALVGFAFACIFYRMRKKTECKAASYRLFTARDELVCLVAEGKLSEDSPVFQYYYDRANYLLKKAPYIGIDRAIEALLTLKNDNFETALADAKHKAEEMLTLVEQEPEEVSNVIAGYYAASRDMMLSHSSRIRLLYIFFAKLNGLEILGHIAVGKIFSFAIGMVNARTVSTLKAVRFADEEAHQFSHVVAHQQP